MTLENFKELLDEHNFLYLFAKTKEKYVKGCQTANKIEIAKEKLGKPAEDLYQAKLKKVEENMSNGKFI